jgi:hypothetical protein
MFKLGNFTGQIFCKWFHFSLMTQQTTSSFQGLQLFSLMTGENMSMRKKEGIKEKRERKKHTG